MMRTSLAQRGGNTCLGLRINERMDGMSDFTRCPKCGGEAIRFTDGREKQYECLDCLFSFSNTAFKKKVEPNE